MANSPFSIPFLDLPALHAPIQEEMDEAYRRVSRSGRFILGHEVEAFEREFAAYCGVAHAVGVGVHALGKPVVGEVDIGGEAPFLGEVTDGVTNSTASEPSPVSGL